MKSKSSYDFYLILATTVVLAAIALICIYGMFAFKMAQIQQMPDPVKAKFMARMNDLVSPFLVGLVLLLGICVPKRLLPVRGLNLFAGLLVLVAVGVSSLAGVRAGLLTVLTAALILQFAVLILALGGSHRLHFEKRGYWVRLGSSLVHLGLILFVFDLFFYQRQRLHLALFWITTVSTVLGMTGCFYAPAVVRWFRPRAREEPRRQPPWSGFTRR